MQYVTARTISDKKITHIEVKTIIGGIHVRTGIWTVEEAIKFLEACGTLKTLHTDSLGNDCTADIEKYGEDAIRSMKDGVECNNLLNLPEIE